MTLTLDEFLKQLGALSNRVIRKKISFNELRVIFTRSSGEDILAIMDNEDNVIDYMKWG